MHIIPWLNQGIGKVYVIVDFIFTGLVELWVTRRKRELQNEKFFPIVGLDPTTSHLLDWRSNQLRHGTELILDIYR